MVEGVIDAELASPLEANAANTMYDLFPTDAQVYQCVKAPPTEFDTSTPPQPIDGVRVVATAVPV